MKNVSSLLSRECKKQASFTIPVNGRLFTNQWKYKPKMVNYISNFKIQSFMAGTCISLNFHLYFYFKKTNPFFKKVTFLHKPLLENWLKCSTHHLPAAAALLILTLCMVFTNGRESGRGSEDLASTEYRNSPTSSLRKITEHWRSPTLKGRKWISTVLEESASRYMLDMGL